MKCTRCSKEKEVLEEPIHMDVGQGYGAVYHEVGGKGHHWYCSDCWLDRLREMDIHVFGQEKEIREKAQVLQDIQSLIMDCREEERKLKKFMAQLKSRRAELDRQYEIICWGRVVDREALKRRK